MVHCPVCHITVAPHDPERVQVELEVFHRSCLQKQRKETHHPDGTRKERQPKQMFFRFNVAQTVH